MLNTSGFTDVYTEFGGFAELRRAARDNAEPALREVAEQFEALFTQMMLKSMRDAGFGNPLFGSQQSKFYRSMFDQQLSLDMAKRSGMGIADMLVEQLKGLALKGEAPIPLPTENGPKAVIPASPPVPTKAEYEAKVTAPTTFDSKPQFLETLRPHAERAARRLGVDPAVLLAQAALETGWGRSIIPRADGSSSHNLFNIKAGIRWSGESAGKSSLEYRDGVAERRRASFRAYDSFAESFNDYADFILGSGRYDEALSRAESPSAYMHGLQKAGYATDPNYAAKVMRIWREELSPELKLTSLGPLTDTEG